MAVASESFSIREYASKMRTVDLAKCWPFEGDSDKLNKEVVEGLLPPITVKKFRWWADEVALVRSKCCMDQEKSKTHEESSKLMSGVATEKSEVVLRSSENRDLLICSVEERPKMKIKAKSWTPKKRSIVEIFAVAPQVERVDDDDDADNVDVGEEEVNTPHDQDNALEEGFLCSKVSALGDVCLNKNGKRKKNTKKKKKKKTKLKETTETIISKDKNLKFKRKGKKNNPLARSNIGNKEKPHKHKLQSPVNFTRKAKGSPYSMGSTSDVLDAVPIHRKKPRLKCSAMKKRNKNFQSSKLLVKHQKPVFPVCGILKKHTNVISGQNSTTCNSQGDNQANQRGDRPLDRHVTFSEKDDILRPRRKLLSSVGCPKSQNICSSYSNAFTAAFVKDHAEESGKDLATVEVTGSDEDASNGTENETEIQPIVEKQLSDIRHHADIPNFLRPHISCQERFSDRPVTVNEVATHNENLRSFERGYRATSDDPSYAFNPGFLSVRKEGYKPNVNTQLCGSISRVSNTNGMVIDNFGDPTAGFTSVSCMDKTFPQPSSSYFRVNGNTNGRILFPSQATQQNFNGHASEYQPYCPVSPKELMGSTYSSTDWKQRNVMCKEQRMKEDFFGLPLNSQGELVQLNSNGKDGYSQLMRTSTVTGSSRNLAEDNNVLPNHTGKRLSVRRAPLKDQLKLFPIQSCVEENPNLPVSSRPGITELQGTGRTDVHWLNSVRADNHYIYPLESDLDLMNISGNGRKQYEQVQNHSRYRNIHLQGNNNDFSHHGTQPTMRLMGKEFIVGKSSQDLEGFGDEKVWMDKQIIAEHHPADTATDNSSIKRQFQQDLMVHPVSRTVKQSVDCMSEIQINQASHCVMPMRPPEFRFSHPYLNCQANIVYQNGCGTINGIPNSKPLPYSSPAVSPAGFNWSPTFQEPFISGYESSKVKSQIPILAPPAHYTCQKMSSNFAELEYRQKLPYATKSLLEFPFLHPECGEHANLSRFQSSSKSQPPWWLNATQQKETSVGSFRTYSDAGGCHHPCTISGANPRNVPPVHHRPEVSYACNPLSSHSSLQDLLGLNALGHPPFMPVRPGCIPTSAIYNSYGERMKSKVCAKDLNNGKKTKKRPATKSDDFEKPSKVPNLEIQDDFIAATALKAGGNFGGDVYFSREPLGLDSNREEGSNLGCFQNDTEEDGLRVSPGIDSSKMDLMARSGPIKLSAGAKHILKPSQNMDECNFRPTHSTIPFAVACSSGQTFEAQKKSAKIYKF